MKRLHAAIRRPRDRTTLTKRLALFAVSAPAVAQLVLLVAMVMEQRWLFVLMIAPGLVGCLASLLTMIFPSDMSAAHTDMQQDAAPIDNVFPAIATKTLEHLTEIDDGTLLWRTIVSNWLNAPQTNVLIGANLQGPATIDIVAQGPHALVAGTTGSGKSALLRSWCLALALRNPPDIVQFVFLDFKGGSAFSSLSNLPHSVGMVDDLDVEHALRAIIGLEHELRRREQLVAEAGVDAIDALPQHQARIIIVIDEFHVLRQQLPDAIERLNRIASLGRSLGMNLIACTQHPLGQVHGDMKSNLSLHICLRVRDPMQSIELIGSAAASLIPPDMPGAMYCDDGGHVEAIRCSQTEHVEQIVNHLCFAGRFWGGTPQEPLFTPPLPHRYTTPRHRSRHDPPPFALQDEGSTYHAVTPSAENGNIAIIGMPGRGKSTALRALATAWGGLGTMPIIITQYTGAEYSTCPFPQAPPPPPPSLKDGTRTIWLIDDAAPLLDPLSNDPLAHRLRTAIRCASTTVVIAIDNSRDVHFTGMFPTRIVFPTGDRASDVMAGLPSELLSRFGHTELTTPGRGILIEPGRAGIIQCALYF